VVVVLCNAPPDHAERLARELIGEHLAACVNILPGVRSIYRWKGEICDDLEHTLLIKVAQDRVQALSERLAQSHPYEVPEILVLPVDASASFAPYVAWVRAESSA